MSGGFYRAFEDRHRGGRALIQSRQEVYLDFLRGPAALHPDAGVVDLGCGRGEWLELLRRQGLRAQGVDLDEGMLGACRELGLQVTRGDAVEFLRALPEASQLAVSGFHIAEHLPFDRLQELVAEALRVLRPGGLLILETPNPENLTVGACAFYMDPTHQRPLPPPLLAFLLEHQGFARVKTMRLQESPALRGDAAVGLLDVLAGVSPDYAVVGQKRLDGTAAQGVPAMAFTDQAFSREFGFTLNELALRHEKQWNARLRRVEQAGEAQAQWTERLRLLEEHARRHEEHARQLDEHARLLQERLQTAEEQLLELRTGWAWQLARPIRWAREQRAAWRQQGGRERGRRAVLKGSRISLRLAGAMHRRFPLPGRMLMRAARSLGMEAQLQAWRQRLAAGVPQAGEPAPSALTPRARRLHEALLRGAAQGRLPPNRRNR